MPRRSDEHLAMRRRQIVVAAARCFARDGFHASSMAHVIAESGLSAGAVYRYFPSKNALVVAVASGVLDVARGALVEAAASSSPSAPPDALAVVLRALVRHNEDLELDTARIGVSVWAEALRDADLHALTRDVYAEIRAGFREALEHWRDAGHLARDADLDAAAQLLLGAALGFVLQRVIVGDVDPDRYARSLGVLGD